MATHDERGGRRRRVARETKGKHMSYTMLGVEGVGWGEVHRAILSFAYLLKDNGGFSRNGQIH